MSSPPVSMLKVISSKVSGPAQGRWAADEEVAVPRGAALHIKGDGVRIRATRGSCVGGGIAIVFDHGSIHVGLEAQVAEVSGLCPSASGLVTAAHLILGLFRIGEAGGDLAAGSDPVYLD